MSRWAARSSFSCRFGALSTWLTFLGLGLLGSSVQTLAAADQPAMHVLTTPGGTRFGLFGEKPASPAPTLFVFAAGVDDMAKQPIYTETGRHLAKQGWVYVAIDPPCHGHDQREKEPGGITGWAHRVKSGQDLMASFTKRCIDVLDFLVKEGYTNPNRIAACGTSRGGLCALHFAAAEPRVRAVTCVSPVTNLLVLTEFAGISEQQVRGLSAAHLTEKLAGRAVWLSIGNDDARVGTDDCITFARKLTAEARRLKSAPKVVPVELVVGPSEGHRAVDDAYGLAAQFVLKQFPK